VLTTRFWNNLHQAQCQKDWKISQYFENMKTKAPYQDSHNRQMSPMP